MTGSGASGAVTTSVIRRELLPALSAASKLGAVGVGQLFAQRALI